MLYQGKAKCECAVPAGGVGRGLRITVPGGSIRRERKKEIGHAIVTSLKCARCDDARGARGNKTLPVIKGDRDMRAARFVFVTVLAVLTSYFVTAIPVCTEN